MTDPRYRDRIDPPPGDNGMLWPIGLIVAAFIAIGLFIGLSSQTNIVAPETTGQSSGTSPRPDNPSSLPPRQ